MVAKERPRLYVRGSPWPRDGHNLGPSILRRRSTSRFPEHGTTYPLYLARHLVERQHVVSKLHCCCTLPKGLAAGSPPPSACSSCSMWMVRRQQHVGT